MKSRDFCNDWRAENDDMVRGPKVNDKGAIISKVTGLPTTPWLPYPTPRRHAMLDEIPVPQEEVEAFREIEQQQRQRSERPKHEALDQDRCNGEAQQHLDPETMAKATRKSRGGTKKGCTSNAKERQLDNLGLHDLPPSRQLARFNLRETPPGKQIVLGVSSSRQASRMPRHPWTPCSAMR